MNGKVRTGVGHSKCKGLVLDIVNVKSGVGHITRGKTEVQMATLPVVNGKLLMYQPTEMRAFHGEFEHFSHSKW